jgi:hypothetical protein
MGKDAVMHRGMRRGIPTAIISIDTGKLTHGCAFSNPDGFRTIAPIRLHSYSKGTHELPKCKVFLQRTPRKTKCTNTDVAYYARALVAETAFYSPAVLAQTCKMTRLTTVSGKFSVRDAPVPFAAARAAAGEWQLRI